MALIVASLIIPSRATPAAQSAGNLALDPAVQKELEAQKRDVADLAKSIDELQAKSKELDATINQFATSNKSVGGLEQRSQSIEATVARLVASTNSLSSSVGVVRSQLPSESILLDNYIALVGQSKEDAVAIEQLQKEVQNLSNRGWFTLENPIIIILVIDLFIGIVVQLFFQSRQLRNYRQQMDDYQKQVKDLESKITPAKPDIESKAPSPASKPE